MVAFLRTQSHWDEKGDDKVYSYRVRAGQAQLFGLDRTEWDAFDAKIAASADRAMVSVDAETVRLFVKYNVEMPATFAKDTRWQVTASLRSSEYFRDVAQDAKQAAALRNSQSTKDRAEINAAIVATDARRLGATPQDWYRLRLPKKAVVA